jgi:hypothetical protein
MGGRYECCCKIDTDSNPPKHLGMHAARIAVSYHELPLLSQFQVFTTSLLKQHVVVVVVVIIIRRMHRSLELLYFSV